MPMVTAGAMASDFGTFKTSTYPLLTRVGPNFNSLSQFIISTLQLFGSVSEFETAASPVLDRRAIDTDIARSCGLGWLGSRVVSVLDSGAERPGFKSRSRRCRVTVLGKLFTPVVPLFTKQQNWQRPS